MESYGETARDFIHVHHIERISDSGSTVVNPIKDLVPLCPNCHAFAHLKTPPYFPEEIREFIKRAKDESV
jgi:5-methylcytosine-specific restriction protein A